MNNEIADQNTRSGYVAIVGRPNVGKSTLLNRILAEKISITSRKSQTTRHRILGIKTIGPLQIIYVDTPGMHLKQQRALNRHMNKAAANALHDVDVVIFVVDSLRWTEEDEWVMKLLFKVSKPIILAVNKTDTVAEKGQLLPHLKALSEKFKFQDIVPISARKGTNVDVLQEVVMKLLPEGPHYFPEEMSTDRGTGFRAAELIREKLIRILGEELPYSTTVEIESFKEEGRLQTIHAIIWVEREGQKPIVIGVQGARLKEIGTRARLDMEKLFGKKIHLKLWVKVRDGWSNDERALASLGYIDLL
jgi:GTP-binding protein Era